MSVANFKYVRPSSLDPRRREKINLNFTFLCGASKDFMKALKTFMKPFVTPQRSAKRKI